MTTLIPALADSGHHWHHGWWIIFPIFWLLLAATIVTLLWRRAKSHGDGSDSPRRILGERFARGEISADEYRERLGQLQ
jgi:putative membrane protein